jgi:hypothetical protein
MLRGISAAGDPEAGTTDFKPGTTGSTADKTKNSIGDIRVNLCECSRLSKTGGQGDPQGVEVQLTRK